MLFYIPKCIRIGILRLVMKEDVIDQRRYELHHKKTGLQGYPPGRTKTFLSVKEKARSIHVRRDRIIPSM